MNGKQRGFWYTLTLPYHSSQSMSLYWYFPTNWSSLVLSQVLCVMRSIGLGKHDDVCPPLSHPEYFHFPIHPSPSPGEPLTFLPPSSSVFSRISRAGSTQKEAFQADLFRLGAYGSSVSFCSWIALPFWSWILVRCLDVYILYRNICSSSIHASMWDLLVASRFEQLWVKLL